MIKRLTDWFGLHPMAGDTIGAAFLALPSLSSTLSMLDIDGFYVHFPDIAVNRVLMPVWGLSYAVPFIWRRTRPALACTLLAMPHLVQLFILPTMVPMNLYVLLMMFAIAAYGSDRARRLWLLLGIVAAMAAAVDWTIGWASEQQLEVTGLTDLPTMVFSNFVVGTVSVIASWLLGAFTRERLTTVRTLRDRADAIAAERDRFAQLAAEQERSRIAREMHDVVAHSLSVIVVQTDGAVYALDQPGDAAAKLGLAHEALERIAVTSREALRETRELVGVLREGEAPEMAPQPGLDEIDELVASTRASGLGIDYAVDGSPAVHPPLGPGREAAAYRIVQESLTNVIKHAGPGAHARVHLSHTGEGLTISVRDDGRGVTRTDGHGHGLIGMRERVVPYGGTLTARPRLDGGFEVLATIPVVEDEETTKPAPAGTEPTLLTRITDLTRKNP